MEAEVAAEAPAEEVEAMLEVLVVELGSLHEAVYGQELDTESSTVKE